MDEDETALVRAEIEREERAGEARISYAEYTRVELGVRGLCDIGRQQLRGTHPPHIVPTRTTTQTPELLSVSTHSQT